VVQVDKKVLAVSLPNVIMADDPLAEAWWRFEKADLSFLSVSNWV
jgi:hypothetical protein